MARRTRIRAGGLTSIFLAWNVYHLVKKIKGSVDGAKTESAEALQDLAHKLDGKLQVFEQIYKDLQSRLPQ